VYDFHIEKTQRTLKRGVREYIENTFQRVFHVLWIWGKHTHSFSQTLHDTVFNLSFGEGGEKRGVGFVEVWYRGRRLRWGGEGEDVACP